jgi:hypothetical protein
MREAFALADEAALLDNSTPEGHSKVAIKTSAGTKLFEPLPDWAMFLRDL